MTSLRQINALHRAIVALYLSSIWNKTALIFQENNKIDTVKKKNKKKKKQLFFYEQWTVSYPIPSFKLVVSANEVNWQE